MSAKVISSWSLPDSVFLPYSIHSIGDNGKLVLIVPGEGQVFTLVIKNLQQNIQSGASPHKVSRIKLAESEGGSLADTVVTSMNTVGCKDSGELVVFSSFRECTTVEGISGVKAISTMDSGKKLVLVRLIGGRTLQLDVFDDLSGCEMGDCLRSFDLSWEKSEFDTSRYSQVHKVTTVVIDRVNSKFFKRFFNCKDLPEGDESILFTMDNGLYWLKTMDDSYEIVTVKLYPALIRDFSFASSTGCFTVLLANAVMHIYSISEDAESLLIQEDSRHLGPTIESHLFINELSTLLYSSGSQITQMRYYYSELSKSIQHVVKDIPITGVTGITYLSFAEMAICVTENRLFYSVPINQLTDCTGNQQNDYFELTSEILSQANQMTCFLANEINIESKIAKEIEKERLQVDIVTSAINRKLANCFAADLKYLKHLPQRCYSTLVLNESNTSTMFVQIDVSFRNGIKEMMMRQNSWMLVLSIDSVVTQIPLGKVNYLEDNTIRLLVAIDEYRFQKHGIPRIETSMSVRITLCQDNIALDIPLKTRTLDGDTVKLLEASSHEPSTTALQERHLSTVAGDLIRHYEQLPLVSPNTIDFKLSGLKDVPNVGKLLSMIGIVSIPNRVDETSGHAYIRLGNQICEVQLGNHHDFRFRSNSPGMLFLLKVLCSKNCPKMMSINADKLKALRLQLAECETEREHIVSYYRQIRTLFGSWR